jgi:hypothetical protein
MKLFLFKLSVSFKNSVKVNKKLKDFYKSKIFFTETGWMLSLKPGKLLALKIKHCSIYSYL